MSEVFRKKIAMVYTHQFVVKHKQPMSARFNMMDIKVTNPVNRLCLRGANQLARNQQRAEE